MFFHNKIYLIVEKTLNLSIDLILGHDSGHYKSLKSCNIYNSVLDLCVNFMYPRLLMRLVDLYVRQHTWPFPCEMSLNYCNWKTHPNQMFVLKVVSVIASVSPSVVAQWFVVIWKFWGSFYVVNFLPKWQNNAWTVVTRQFTVHKCWKIHIIFHLRHWWLSTAPGFSFVPWIIISTLEFQQIENN